MLTTIMHAQVSPIHPAGNIAEKKYAQITPT